MRGPDEDDVVEQGGSPLRLPGWAGRLRRPPAFNRRPSRGAAILGVAGLVAGLAGGYALGYRQLRENAEPSRPTPARTAAAAAAPAAIPSAAGGFAAQVYPPPAPGGPAYSSSLGVTGLSGLAQTGGACSVQHGRELQVGVEVINLSATPVTLGQVKPVLPQGGLRPVSQQWAPCGALSPSWQAADGGMIVFIRSSTGVVEAGSATPGSAAVLPPDGTAWLSVTFTVLVACPRSLPVQFSVGYQQGGRTGTAQLTGFPVLGDVPYSGCKGGSQLAASG
jgi:hypothetical protein